MLRRRRAKKFKIDDAHRYIEETLRREEKILHGEYSLARFGHGKSASLFKIEPREGAPMVIRFHTLNKMEIADRYFGFCRFLSELGIQIPELIFTDRRPATERRFGFQVSVEKFIEGSHFSGEARSNVAATRALAGLAAKFHNVTSPSHGLPWDLTRGKTLYETLLSDVRKYTRNLSRKTDLLEPSEAASCLAWFEQWRGIISSIAPYHLIHGDFHANNVIVHPKHGITVIDFRATQFGYPELDLARCELSFLEDGSAAHKVFFEEYARMAGEEMAERYRRNAPFFTAYLALGKASTNASKTVRLLRRGRTEKKPHEEKCRSYLARMRACMGSTPISGRYKSDGDKAGNRSSRG